MRDALGPPASMMKKCCPVGSDAFAYTKTLYSNAEVFSGMWTKVPTMEELIQKVRFVRVVVNGIEFAMMLYTYTAEPVKVTETTWSGSPGW